jgi:hypothetical protein
LLTVFYLFIYFRLKSLQSSLHEKESQLSHLENLSESEKVLKRNQIENLQSELDNILADIKHEVSNLVTFNDILNWVKLQYCIGKNPVDLSSRI